MIAKGLCSPHKGCADEGRRLRRGWEHYPRSLGSLVAELRADPGPPDAQTHILPSGSCSWSKALALLSWERPILAW